MKLTEALTRTRGIPFIDESKRTELYEFVLGNKPKKILELGFAHGVSTCIMAAALDELPGHGTISTIDILPAREWQDKLMSIEKLSSIMNLDKYIQVFREKKSYTWWLKKELERKKADRTWQPYDFIFIDGAHNWTIDTAAFFLCEKILRTGGWILFDDLKYSYCKMIERDGRIETAGVSHYDMSDDELKEPAVGQIFELLVIDHEHLGEFRYSQNSDWGWARKLSDGHSWFDDLRRCKWAIERRLKYTNRV